MSAVVFASEVRDGVRHVSLNRPEKRNALNRELITALSEQLRQAADDDATRVVLIRGEGKDFCAGADLEEMTATADAGSAASLENAMTLGNLFIQMRSHSQPIIAAVHGRALAGGCGLATACDMVLASDDAMFGYPEVNLGFVPAMVMAILRKKVHESVAFELITTGESISAARAQEIGLVNRVYRTGDFLGATTRMARELADKPASALKLSKALLYELDGAGFTEAIERGANVNAGARETEAYREGVRDFLDRSKD